MVLLHVIFFFWLFVFAQANGMPTRALLFDSWFDSYRGVISMIQVCEGELRRGDKITLASTGESYDISEIGVMHPDQVPVTQLSSGQVRCRTCALTFHVANKAFVGFTVRHQ